MTDFLHRALQLLKDIRTRIAAAAVLAASLAFPAWQHFYPVQAGKGWSYTVYLDAIPYVSALASDGRGNLYVSQANLGNQGRILRFRADTGPGQEVLARLGKPTGMAPFLDGLVIGQEAGKRPVLWWQDGGEAQPLFNGNSVEGLATDGRYLFAIEDTKDARLLKYDPGTKAVTTLRDHLEEAEGVAVCPDGRMYFSEKKKGWVKRYRPGGEDEIVATGLKEPGFLLCDQEGIWISEDTTHLGRLLLLHGAGRLNTVLSHTRSGQSLLALGPGRYLFAEQGRQRVLELRRTGDAATP